MQSKPVAFTYWENVALYCENKFVRFLYIKIIMLILAALFTIAEIISVVSMLKKSEKPNRKLK